MLCVCLSTVGQQSFPASEYLDLLDLSLTTHTHDTSKQLTQRGKTQKYERLYRSPEIGLMNRWELWMREDGTAVISLRGTVMAAPSWMENFYAGMIPATGSLKINEARLTAALERLDDLQAFFSRDEAGTESDGFGVLFRSFASERLAEGGSLPARQAALRERVTTMSAQRERIEERLARTEERLTAQYSRLDTSLSKLNALQSYVDQQVKSWNQAKD